MPTVQHQVVKPEKLAATALGLVQQELVLPLLFHREGIDKFRGADDDTVQVKVPGTLPSRTYAWRNDRSQPIVFDNLVESKVSVSFGGNHYSAVKLTDEQYDFDLDSWAELLTPQAEAVARGLERAAAAQIASAPYNVTIGNTARNHRGAIIEARRVLNALRVPQGQRFIVVGSNYEASLLEDDKLNLASNVGDRIAESALEEASLGRKYGFNFVSSPELDPDTAIAMVPSAFIFLSGAPYVPASVPFGATLSHRGIALRWLRDYDSEYMQDRSVVNTYAGFDRVTDKLTKWNPTTNQEEIVTGQHFIRAIKLTLDGASNYPAAASDLAGATGVSDANVWTPTGRGAETDVTDPGANNS